MGGDEGHAADDEAAEGGDAGDGRDAAGRVSADELTGRPLDEAVDAVVGRGESADRDRVRAALDRVAVDGTVTEEGVRDALARLAKVVSTPETRVEFAERALADAREAAAEAPDLDIVDHRLGTFERRLDAVDERVAELGDELQRLVRRADEPGDAYDVAVEIGRLTGAANEAQRAADELGTDLESFERWLRNPALRAEELEADAAALAESVDALEATVDALSTADERDGGTGEDEAAGDDAGPADRWLRAAVRHRLLDLLVRDARAERRALGTWAEREGEADEGRLRDVAARLEELDDRLAECDRRLASLAAPARTAAHGDRLAAFEDELAEMEPPVDWAAVQATYEAARPEDAPDDAPDGA